MIGFSFAVELGWLVMDNFLSSTLTASSVVEDEGLPVDEPSGYHEGRFSLRHEARLFLRQSVMPWKKQFQEWHLSVVSVEMMGRFFFWLTPSQKPKLATNPVVSFTGSPLTLSNSSLRVCSTDMPSSSTQLRVQLAETMDSSSSFSNPLPKPSASTARA